MNVRRTILAATMASALVVGGAAPALAGAQPAATQAVAPSCLAQVPVADSVDAAIHLSLSAWRPVGMRVRAPEPSAEQREALTLVLQELRQSLVLPSTIPLEQHDSSRFHLAGDTARRPQMVHPSLDASFALTLDADGRTVRFVSEERSFSVALDAALVAMLQRAGSTGAFPNLAGALGADSAGLLLETTHEPRANQVSTQLVRLRLPTYTYEPPSVLKGPSPEFPERARREDIVDRVTMQFVVDTLGRVDMSTARRIDANHASRDQAFAGAVHSVLPHYRFRPMLIGGCPTRSRVRLPFVFELR
ncbi:MAG TPA: energy transducer TonB [Gemmatimonadaceae bacterium]|nr:energy transducer TonB [Gemmatimonadaceae bacterium]